VALVCAFGAFEAASLFTPAAHLLRNVPEKAEAFLHRARETMLARHKRLQLGVVGWNAKRKAIGFFGHVTEQVSGQSKSEAVEEKRAARVKPQSRQH
jgi:hypothetical protein